MPRSIFWALINFPLLITSTCPDLPDLQTPGKLCQKNSECMPDMLCFFGEENEIGYGNCCTYSFDTYRNAMFGFAIGDKESRISADLFYPQRAEPCESSKQCQSNEDPTTGPNLQTLWHSNSATLANHCYKIPKMFNFKFIRIWRSDKLIIYSPLNHGRSNMTVDKAELVMEEMDEADERSVEWKFALNGLQLYYWKQLSDCYLRFKGSLMKDIPPAILRIRGADLSCTEAVLDSQKKRQKTEDLEIFGGSLFIRPLRIDNEGVCGNPGLNCPDCFIDGKLHTCTKHEDCYRIGDAEWINRNEKSYCSDYSYLGKRLCKTKQYTCPPDSFNSDGVLLKDKAQCVDDVDCEDMEDYANISKGKEKFFPHCFYGRCCARRMLCDANVFPYALPVEANSLKEQAPCLKDEECDLFPDFLGTCVHHQNVTNILENRRFKYFPTNNNVKPKGYGMCCYSKKSSICSTGGTPFEVELSDGPCSNHIDCNPDELPFKWNAYCSQNAKSNMCCRDTLVDSLCPDGFTPYRTQQKCEGYHPLSKSSGKCPKSNGMCHRGHCCPRLTIDEARKATPYHLNYVTDTQCDPTEPLDFVYRWAFCDEIEEKIVVMGDRNADGTELNWQQSRCTINSDCGHPKFRCVHQVYGLRYCVVPPDYTEPNDRLDVTYLSIFIIATFLTTLLIIICTPTPAF
eukprot:NP_496574.3 Uncharacterized protein CELE_Y17G7B.19 [Caenorhabditis elegans]